MRINVREAGFGVALGVVAGIVTRIVAGIVAGVAVVVIAGVAAVFVSGIDGVPGDLAEATSPRTVFAQDRRAALLLVLAGAAAFGVVTGVVAAAALGVVAGVVTGVVAGTGMGLLLSGDQTAWPSYLLTVGWLGLSHRLPRSMMGFLADAHRRGVLRQAGAVYQFRHIELQHRLANRDIDKQEPAH